jgi:glutamyl-tRNA(Gln) amidotransferase subunit E
LERVDDFEYIITKTNLDPTTVGSALAYTLKELKRDGKDISKLDNEILVETFVLVDSGKIAKDAVNEILNGICDDVGSPEEIAIKLNLVMLSESDVESIIDGLIEENIEMIKERKMGAMGPLMGKSMAKLQGKADGKLVNKFLKDKIQSIISG